MTDTPTPEATPAVDAVPAEASTAGPGPAEAATADAQPPGAIEADAPSPTPHDFGELAATASAGGGGSLNMLFDLMMPVSVELGRAAMTVREVLDLTRGSVIPLNRLAGEPIDIYVSDRKLAEGEVVVLGEHFGVRLTRIVSPGTVPGAAPQEARSA